VAQANALRREYEDCFGPLYSFRSMSASPWEWNDDPWPWQYCFNFNLPREEW
jgi:spore coat protein JB